MATKVTLIDISSGFKGTDIQTNFTSIEDEFDKVVYRDGTSPNQMEARLDMNSFSIENLGRPSNNEGAARLKDVLDNADSLTSATAVTTSIDDTKGHYDSTNVEAAFEELADGGTVVEVTAQDYTALRAIVTSILSNGDTRYLRGRTSVGDGGEGHFRWDSSDLSTSVSNDEVTASQGDGGIYIAPASDKTGASGAWVRMWTKYLLPEMYGAVGDGVTDDHNKFSICSRRCQALGRDMWVSDKTYLMGDIVPIKSNVDGTGTIKVDAAIPITPDGRAGVWRVSAKVIIENITFNCNSASAAIEFVDGDADGSVVRYITSDLSFRAHIVDLGGAEVKDCEIYGCTLTNAGQAADTFGDGMYFVWATNFHVHDNTVDGYERIGIVFEGKADPTKYSYEPSIHDNVCKNGTQSVAGTSEWAAGIWTENTIGGRIYSNNVQNMTNTVADYEAVGIKVGGYSAGAPANDLDPRCWGNTIDNCYMGIQGGGQVWGNEIRNFKTGVYAAINASSDGPTLASYRDNKFLDATFDFDGDTFPTNPKYPNCVFLVNSDREHIEIDGIHMNNITHTGTEPGLADIIITNARDPERITIRNVYYDPGIIIRNDKVLGVNRLAVENATILLDLGETLFAEKRLTFNRCKFIEPSFGHLIRAEHVKFIECELPINGTVRSSSATSFVLEVMGCEFQAGFVIQLPNNEDGFVRMTGNTGDALTRDVIQAEDGPVFKGRFDSNFLFNNAGGHLIQNKNSTAGSAWALDGNSTDDGTALTSGAGTSTETESDTVTL